jgi:ABC transporter substrate binding protein (PQQ-dependent alcohol dehydrogenase system)
MISFVRIIIAFGLFLQSMVGIVHADKKQEKQKVTIVFLSQYKPVPPALSNLDPFIQHKGLQGAEMAIDDNNTTGQFTGQQFVLKTVLVPENADVISVFKQQALDADFIVVNITDNQLLHLADLDETADKLIFDAVSRADELRNTFCRQNVLHILPSRAMRADALAQYMLKKRWQKWFLVTGPSENDKRFSWALHRAADRFGMQIVAEKSWTHSYDARRTAQSDVPVFTQDVDDYDVLVVADEQGLFGEYFSYRTWLPRPVIGTQGLIATAWHRTHEQWGAVQMQNRFKEKAGRWMEEEDYGAYLAVRAIGEAATRTKSNQVAEIKAYLLSDQLALQGYKGKPLSFRRWNGQLRQPVLLAAPRSLVTAAPLEGFLHPETELDTLGYDQPESLCPSGEK